jgi:hypothetical protein
VSEDPLQTGNSYVFSLYAYARNDSVDFRDPTGWAATGGTKVGGGVVCTNDGRMEPDVKVKCPTCPELENCVLEHEMTHIEWNKKHMGEDYCKKHRGTSVEAPTTKDKYETECLAYIVSYKCLKTAADTETPGCGNLLIGNRDCNEQLGITYCKLANIPWPYQLMGGKCPKK